MAVQAGSGQNYFDTAIFNAQIPDEGPKAMAVAFPFTSSPAVRAFSVDLTLTQNLRFMSLVQGAFIDNSANSQALIITSGNLGQVIEFPPLAQGYIPILAAKPSQFTVAIANAANVTPTVIFLNIPVPALIWYPAGQSGGGGGGGTTTLAASQVNVTATEVQLVTSATSAIITNAGADFVYLGPTSAVTSASGFPLFPGGTFNTNGYTGPIYAISAAGKTNLVGVATFS